MACCGKETKLSRKNVIDLAREEHIKTRLHYGVYDGSKNDFKFMLLDEIAQGIDIIYNTRNTDSSIYMKAVQG